jgi:hypothetical protein
MIEDLCFGHEEIQPKITCVVLTKTEFNNSGYKIEKKKRFFLKNGDSKKPHPVRYVPKNFKLVFLGTVFFEWLP